MSTSDQASSDGVTPSEELNDGSTATAIYESDARKKSSKPASDGDPLGPATKPVGASGADGTVAWFPVAPSSNIGRYEPVKFLGRGGMGEVWSVRDREIGREVALKRMRQKSGQTASDRFLAEAQITGQLEHPGIVPVHDLGIDSDGDPFYVMRRLPDSSLKDLIEECHAEAKNKNGVDPLKQLRMLEVFMQACHAVAYAHHRGVVHRDIKPAHVVAGNFGETIVLDWGLAKLLHGEETSPFGYTPLSSVRGSGETRAGSVVGTAQYIAPEQASGKPEEVDRRTDVYLLGATLFEILTGQPPRSGTSAEQMLELARSAPVVSPRLVNKYAPKPLAAICLKAMARRKQDRYDTVEALAEDVRRYIAGEPVSAYREGLGARLWRQAKRHRKAIGRAAAVLAFAGLTVLALALWNRSRALHEREVARPNLASFREILAAGMGEAGIDSPGEGALYFDRQQGIVKLREAMSIAEPWGERLERLPLVEERERATGELRELLLTMAQTQASAATTAAEATEAKEWLERAGMLGEPSQAWYYSAARIASLEGDRKSAADLLEKASDPKTPRTASDFFLEGERQRIGAAWSGQLEADAASEYDPFDDEPLQLVGGPSAAVAPTRRQSLEKAAEAYRSALKLNPRHYWTQFQLGRCYLALGRTAEGIEALGACIAIDPQNPWAYSSRGLALAMSRRFEEAWTDCEAALVIDAEFAPAKLHRGIANMLEGKDRDSALKDFGAVLDLPEGKRLVEAAWYRGQMLMKDGKHDEQALADFALVAKERPRLRQAQHKIAELRLARGETALVLAAIDAWLGATSSDDFERARRRARAIRRLPGNSTIANRIRGPAFALALAQLEAVKEQMPADPVRAAEYYEEIARLYKVLKQKQNAQAAIDQALAVAPLEAAGLRAKLLHKRGWLNAHAKATKEDLAEALADFHAGLPGDPALKKQLPWWLESGLRSGIGYTSARLRDEATARDEALKVGEVCSDSGRNDYRIEHNLACIYAALSEFEAEPQNQDLAIVHLRRGAELDEENARKLLDSDIDSFPDELQRRPEFERLLPTATKTP